MTIRGSDFELKNNSAQGVFAAIKMLNRFEDMLETGELVFVGKWCDCTKCKNNEICYIYHQSGGGKVEKQNCSHFVAKE